MKANFGKVLLLLLGPILAEDASFASGDYELFPDLEFSGDDYEILTYETNHGILQETTELGKESLESFTPVGFSQKPTQERGCGGLGIVFNDEGDKFWVNEGIEQLRTLLKAIERYKSLHLTIVRVSWNKPDGLRIFDGLIRTAPQLFDHVIGKIDLNIPIGSPFGYSSELFDSLKESNNLYDSPIIISKTHSPFRKKTEVAIEKYTRELVPLKCKNFHECDVGLEQLHIIISGPPGDYLENTAHSSIWRESIRIVQKLLHDLSSLRTIVSVWIPSSKSVSGFAREFRKQGEDVILFGKLCEKSSQLIWNLDFLPAVPRLTKEVETLVGFIERDMKDSTGVIGIISFETSPSLNLPGSIPVFVSISSNDVVQSRSVNVDKEFFNDRDGFIAAISDLVRKDPGTLFQEEKSTTPTVIEDRKIIQWSLWTQNFSRGDKTNCFTHQNDLFFRQNIRNARDGTETLLETALHPIKMGENAKVLKAEVNGEYEIKMVIQNEKHASKQRAELKNCFSVRPDPEILALKKERNRCCDTEITCQAVNHDPDSRIIYEFDMKISRATVTKPCPNCSEPSMILTQWHGTPNRRRFRDSNQCVGDLSFEDYSTICCENTEWYSCKNGLVMEKIQSARKDLWSFIGIEQEQGGKPPLIFGVKKGKFYISARSDSNFFKNKGGCALKPEDIDEYKVCDENGEQVYVLWRQNVTESEELIDKWVRWRYEIKWSKFHKTKRTYHPTPAFLKVSMNDKIIVDSASLSPDLFMGRNDEVLPYFKVGIYNSDGSAEGGESAEVTIRKYKESLLKMEAEEIKEEKGEVKIHEETNEVYIVDLEAGSGERDEVLAENVTTTKTVTTSTEAPIPVDLVAAPSKSRKRDKEKCRNGKKKLGPDGECVKLSKEERRRLRKEGKIRKPREAEENAKPKLPRSKATNMLRFKDLTHVNSTFEFLPTEYGKENERCVLQPFGTSISHNLNRELSAGFRDMGYERKETKAIVNALVNALTANDRRIQRLEDLLVRLQSDDADDF